MKISSLCIIIFISWCYMNLIVMMSMSTIITHMHMNSDSLFVFHWMKFQKVRFTVQMIKIFNEVMQYKWSYHLRCLNEALLDIIWRNGFTFRQGVVHGEKVVQSWPSYISVSLSAADSPRKPWNTYPQSCLKHLHSHNSGRVIAPTVIPTRPRPVDGGWDG